MSDKVKNKVFVLPIIDKNNTQNLRSNMEEDIKFYGILSLKNILNINFKPGSLVHKDIMKIVPIGDCKPVNVVWSRSFFKIHHKTLRTLSELSLDFSKYGILCVGYEANGIFDVQLGATGTVEPLEKFDIALTRELKEECNVDISWIHDRVLTDIVTKRWGKFNWKGYIVGVE